MIFLKESEQDIVSRNRKIFLITNIDAASLLVPVIVLLWLDAGLSFSEMLLLQGLFALTILLLEVPSGAFADSWSRKGCALTYQVFFGIGLFIYSVADSFIVFAIAEMVAGVGVACKTGADSALIYDSLKNENRENEMRSILATAQTLSLVCAVVGAILGGFLGSYSLRIPVALAGMVHIVMIFIALMYIEPERQKAASSTAATRKAATSLVQKPVLIGLLIFSLSSSIPGRIIFWGYQPILLNVGFQVIHFGLLFASFNLIAALGSLLIRKLNTDSKDNYFLAMILSLDCLTAFAFLQIRVASLVVLIIWSQQLLRGLRYPLFGALVQRNLDSDERATFISLVSTLGSLLYFFVTVIIDFLSLSLTKSLTVAAFMHVLLTLGFLVLVLYQIPTKIIARRISLISKVSTFLSD